VYSALVGWDQWETENIKVNTLSKTPFSKVIQDLSVSDSIINIEWIIKKENDSVTKVTALLTHKNNSIIQKIKAPFFKTDFVKRGITTINRLKLELKSHHDKYVVSQVKKAVLPKTECLCISMASTLQNKAYEMIEQTAYLVDFMRLHKIQASGSPFLQVTNWDINNDYINFDFCFPVNIQNNIPNQKGIKFKTLKQRAALKTVFNGNYKISDRAWFTMLDYAHLKKISVENLPVEYFHNDPHNGEPELQWQAEVFMPLKHQ
jgi:effector-binding domain-containing protein